MKILFIVVEDFSVEVFPAKKKLKQKTFCEESLTSFDPRRSIRIEMQKQIESLSIIHGDSGVIFLEHVKKYTECVIKYETLAIFKTFESLERFDVNEEMEITGLNNFILDNIPNGGLNLIHNNILKYLYSEFERQMPECKRLDHSNHRQWFIAFPLFLKLILFETRTGLREMDC
ncbi:hypothetical protein RFI_25214 [Reticulomyxa filosa]|uniref:Uncharacterized protein n=1 Tax=Reticulomyxa filosa TaxID=46433 RepID=X6MFG0_RETFI|nr:hypothetical protein RFI_25214 [Reticulomyxa filosa]|eukprot:ETO12162.1 hypothetical protein RFI_25214 [Reticulomyxa filosa]